MAAVDVVVVSYNSRERLRQCVESLVGEPSVTAFIVDNASQDRSLDVVADLDVTPVALRTNLGFGHGCNVGWRLGSAPYVLFVNPDAVISYDSVERLVAVLDRDSGCGVVGPRILEEDGSLDFSIRRFPRLRSTFAQALFVHRFLPRAAWTDEVVRDPRRYDRAGEAEWISGACMLFRRSTLEEIGGFDEGFFLYAEDKDICRRVWGSGQSVRFESDALAVHVGGASGLRTSLLPVLAASRVRYARKHRRRLGALAERSGIALGELTHLLVGRGGSPARAGHAGALGVALGLRRTSRSAR